MLGHDFDPDRAVCHSERNGGAVVSRSPSIGHGEIVELVESFRVTHEVLGRLKQSRLNASPPVMSDIEATVLVVPPIEVSASGRTIRDDSGIDNGGHGCETRPA